MRSVTSVLFTFLCSLLNMSLRQLKFKPKLQPNPAKHKTDFSTNRSTVKEAVSDITTSTPHTKSPNGTELLEIQAGSSEKTSLSSDNFYSLKVEDSSVSVTKNLTSSQNVALKKAVDNSSSEKENISECTGNLVLVQARSSSLNFEKSQQDIYKCILNNFMDTTKLEVNSSQAEPLKDPVEQCFEELNKVDSKLLAGSDVCSQGVECIKNHQLEGEEIHIKALKTNSEYCENITEAESKTIILNVFPIVSNKDDTDEKVSENHFLNITQTIEQMKSEHEIFDRSNLSEKKHQPQNEVIQDKPTKVLQIHCNSNTELTKNDDTIFFKKPVSRNDSDKKISKKKKLESKPNVSGKANQNKVSSHQRANFKPNLAALGKIRRPMKFPTSSYSKMESVAKEQFFKKFGNEGQPDSSKLTMMDLIFYNPSSNPMSQSSDRNVSSNSDAIISKPESLVENISVPEEVEDDANTDEDSESETPVPQLKISADGKVIVAQESLVVMPSKNLSNVNFQTVIDGDIKKRKPIRNPNRCSWSHLDTINFYKALNTLGCDFETMLSLFPGRSRQNLKSKFKKEEKMHGSLVDKVLRRHSEFDLNNVVRELDIDQVYQNTLKNFGRSLAGKGKRRKGRKKPFSAVLAGKAPSKYERKSDEDDLVKDEKHQVHDQLMSNTSNGLTLKTSFDSLEAKDKRKLAISGKSTWESKESKATNNSNLMFVEFSDSDSDDGDDNNDVNYRAPRNILALKENENQDLKVPPRVLRKRRKAHHFGNVDSNNIIIRLEDLMDFNEGVDDDQTAKKETNENHIVINTNIEFDNVKYTRYISYNSNNLENPIEINETVAHVV